MNTYKAIITIFAILFNLIILLFPKEIIKATENGLLLWYKYALPSLFPFMIGINFLKSTPFPLWLSKALKPITSRLFNIKGYGTFAIISGFLSGYPIGAKTVCDLYRENKLSKSEAQYLISFTNNSGPLFIIGTVGIAMLKSKGIGYYLLIIHYISAVIIGLLTNKPKSSIYNRSTYSNFSFWDNIRESLTNSINSIVGVGGYIILFSIICSITTIILDKTNLALSQSAMGLIYSILEVTNGCKALSNISQLNISIISGAIAFGGLSIQCQSISYISQSDLSIKKYFITKVFQGLISFGLCFFSYRYFTHLF